MKLSPLLNQMLLVCLCLFALTGQSIADPLSEAKRADTSGNYAEAAKLFKPLAEQGNAEAQYFLGVIYGNGHGVPQDYKEAVKWYRLAAEQGDTRSQQQLGAIYSLGSMVPQVPLDYQEAVKWYRLGAEQGDATAQSFLGLMYKIGHGVPQDYVLAHMWENVAAANADASNSQHIVVYRDDIATHMTPEQIAEAQKLARKCTANKFKGC